MEPSRTAAGAAAGPPASFFTAGAAGAASAAATEGAAVADSLDHEARSLFEVVAAVGAATVQVGQAGSEAQIAKAHQLLSDTRKALYRILAEEEDGPEPEAGG